MRNIENMKKMIFKSIFTKISIGILLCVYPNVVFAGDFKSDPIKPKWILDVPVSHNPTYTFKSVYVEGMASLQQARNAAKVELLSAVEREERVRLSEEYKRQSFQKVETNGGIQESIKDIYAIDIVVDGKPVQLEYMKVAEYWEDERDGRMHNIKLYTLYMVAKPGATVSFDEITFTPHYGARGLIRSVFIPGWGQLYKGSTMKGLCMLGGTATIVTGIVIAENTRADYKKKMKEQPKLAAKYNSKADSWETARNICIGAAAALYIYNIVDAIVADGAKRTVIRKHNNFSMQPQFTREYSGFLFTYNF